MYIKIKKINFTGKWVEVWIEGSNSYNFDFSFKSGQILDIVKKFNLENEIDNYGYVGKILELTEDKNTIISISMEKE